MLTFKTYLNEQKEKKKEVEKTYHKVFIGKTHHNIDSEEELEKYNKIFVGKLKKLDENIITTDRHLGRSEDEVKKLHSKLTRHYVFGKKISKKQEPALDDPDGDQKYAIRRYTGAMYKPINRALYKGDTSDLGSHHQDILENMKKVTTRHKTPVAMTVSSGIKTDPRTLEQHEGQIRMQLPAFTSTTIHADTAKDFARLTKVDPVKGQERHVVHIDVPKGSHGAYIAHHSQIPEEREFVLHPGARIHVDPTPHVQEEKSFGERTTTYHWNAKLVHDGVRDV